MKNWTVTQIIAIILLILLVIWAIYRLFRGNTPKPLYQPNAVPLNQLNSQNNQTSNFSNPIESQDTTPFILYYFYSPGCPHCDNFSPAWEEVFSRLKNVKNLTIRKVDTSKPENENLAFYYNITGSPTVILVTPDKNIEYFGNRSAEDVYQFVTSNLAQYNGPN